MENTSGFYRVDVNGDFQFAPNGVISSEYTLGKSLKDTYNYPTEGNWYWFESEESAKLFFNIE